MPIPQFLKTVTAFVMLMMLIALPAKADNQRLTINGALPAAYLTDEIHLDMAALSGLGLTSITTMTEQLDGRRTFEGVLVEALLQAVGTNRQTIHAAALDGYSLDIPREDLRRHGAILAITVDGQPLSTIDKGPFWIIFPFDDMTVEEIEAQGPNSVWQLTTITLK